MNRRGFLGLLGAVPLAGAVPRAVSAEPLTRRIRIARRVVADLDLSTVVPGSLVICKRLRGDDDRDVSFLRNRRAAGR
jgi:hypothetical protein